MSRRSIALVDPRRMFRDDFWDDFPLSMWNGLSVSSNNLNMYETPELVVVELEAPGWRPNDVEITVEDNVLTVAGKVEKKEAEEDPDRKYYYREINQQSFARTVSLPSKVKAENAEATFIDGLIKISMPKAEEVKPKKITVKAK